MHAQTVGPGGVSMLARESTLPILAGGGGVSRDIVGGVGGVVGGVGTGVGAKLSHAQAAMAAGLPPGGFPGVNEKGASPLFHPFPFHSFSTPIPPSLPCIRIIVG